MSMSIHMHFTHNQAPIRASTYYKVLRGPPNTVQPTVHVPLADASLLSIGTYKNKICSLSNDRHQYYSVVNVLRDKQKILNLDVFVIGRPIVFPVYPHTNPLTLVITFMTLWREKLCIGWPAGYTYNYDTRTPYGNLQLSINKGVVDGHFRYTNADLHHKVLVCGRYKHGSLVRAVEYHTNELERRTMYYYNSKCITTIVRDHFSIGETWDMSNVIYMCGYVLENEVLLNVKFAALVRHGVVMDIKDEHGNHYTYVQVNEVKWSVFGMVEV